jgi:hypothetical protein
MRPQLSGFGDIQQWISGDRHRGAWPINQKKPSNHKHSGDAERQGQDIVHDEITSHDAKQRGDEGKS